jgi:hypothetical protein
MTPNTVGEVLGASWDDDAIRAQDELQPCPPQTSR